jgi:hypothetical protein
MVNNGTGDNTPPSLNFPRTCRPAMVTALSPQQEKTLDFIHSAVPHALLRAVQQVDRTPDDGLTDSDLAAKKFGASKTVTDQIERYGSLNKGDKSVPSAEIVGLLNLVSRRLDHELVVKIAGQDAARHEVDRAVRLLKLGATFPGRLGAGLKRRVAARATTNLLASDLTFPNGQPHVVSPAGTLGEVQAVKCLFDGSAVAEILHIVIGFSGALAHTKCCAQGDSQCAWSVITTEGD